MNASHPHALWEPGKVVPSWPRASGAVALAHRPTVGSARFPRSRFSCSASGSVAVLFTEFEVPGIGALSVVNVHLSPDPPYMQPDDTLSRGYRVHEIDSLLAEASKGRADTILAGDFNAGPEICWHDHQRLLDGGYGDVFAAVHGHKTYAPTYDRAKCSGSQWPLSALARPARRSHSSTNRIETKAFKRGNRVPGAPADLRQQSELSTVRSLWRARYIGLLILSPAIHSSYARSPINESAAVGLRPD